MLEWDAALLEKMAAAEKDPDFPAERALSVKMLALDADGVLTDGGLYYDDRGLALKRFDAQDGLGIKLAREAGIEIVIISGMRSGALARRAADLLIAECRAGQFDKALVLEEIMRQRGLQWGHVAYMGDDWIDLPLLRRVGLALTARNAQPEVRVMAHYVSPCSGGHGAVRQVLRQIFLAQGRQMDLLTRFVRVEEQKGAL